MTTIYNFVFKTISYLHAEANCSIKSEPYKQSAVWILNWDMFMWLFFGAVNI